ncbi:MAG: carboxypeptidase-like regulatory domain-containing protein [Gemmatimonadota bacterium]
MAENGSSGEPHVDEGTMHAWLDGALPADEGRAVELHVASCETCAAAAAEARGLIAASTRILSALDDVPGDVVPVSARPVPAAFDLQTSASRRAKPVRGVRAYVSIAAAAVVVVALGLVVREKSAPVTRAAPSVAARAIDTDIGGGVVPQAESSVAIASAAPKGTSHDGTQKPRVPSPAAPKSQVAVAPKSHGESLSAVAVAGVAAAAKAAPSADSLTVTGRVTAVATGLPLADARVSVAGTDAVAATDSTGRFKVSVAQAGSHVLTARKIGFAANSATVNLQADSVAQVTLALPSQSTALAEVVTTAAAGVLQRTGGFAKPLPSITGARVISSNVYDAGTSRVRHTTFQLDSGSTVTLDERRPIAAPPAAEDRSDTSAHVDAGVRAAPLALRSPSGLATRAITWTSVDGTSFTLSGPLSLKELEQLKNRIVP